MMSPYASDGPLCDLNQFHFVHKSWKLVQNQKKFLHASSLKGFWAVRSIGIPIKHQSKLKHLVKNGPERTYTTLYRIKSQFSFSHFAKTLKIANEFRMLSKPTYEFCETPSSTENQCHIWEISLKPVITGQSQLPSTFEPKNYVFSLSPDFGLQ